MKTQNKSNILYVDDEMINLQLFKHMFKSMYDVVLAKSGFEGLEMLEKYKDIDIVISDMRMPGMNGLEFIKKAKNRYSNIPFYILTAYDITEEIEEAIKQQVVDKYFKKPFRKADLLFEIQKVVA